MNPALLASLLAFSSPEAGTVEDDVQEILEDDRYAFCQEDRSFVPLGEEYAWCPLVGRDNPRCPGFGDHCAAETSGGGSYAGGSDGTPTSVRQRHDRRGVFKDGAGGTDPDPSPQLQVTPGLSAFSQMLLWGICIGAGLLLLWTIARGRGLDEEEASTVETGGGVAPDLDHADVQRRQIETDVARLLERARRAASEGEYRRAVDDVYAALLRRLDGDGLIEIHHARTNGDYLRALRQHPQLRQEVRQILREVERVQFGDTEPDEPLFRRVLEQVKPLVSRQLGALLLAFGLGLGLAACNLEGDEHEGLAGLSTDPLGGRAVVQLLRRHGMTVDHRTRTIEQLRASESVVLMLGDVSPTPEEWDILLDWTREGGILVLATGNEDLPPELGVQVVDGWQFSDDRPELAFVGGYQYAYDGYALRTPRFGHLERTGAAAVVVDMIVRPSDEAPPDFDPYDDEMYADQIEPVGDVYATRVDVGEGHVLVFADEMLFSNAAMAVDDDARFVVDLMSEYGRDIEVIDEWTGTGAQSPLASIANSHLTPVILQLLAFMTLLYLWRGVAFARLKDPPTRGRRAFVDHVHALALQYAKARASRHVLSAYAGWVLERLRHRVAPGSDRTLHGLAQAVAARTGRDESAVMRLLIEAHTMREGAAHASGVYTARRRDLEVMRELSSLLTESKRTREKK